MRFKVHQRDIKKQWDVCVYTDREKCVYGTYKEFIVTMMVQAVVNVQSKYGEEAAMKELMGMMTEAAQQYCAETKKGAEKHELN